MPAWRVRWDVSIFRFRALPAIRACISSRCPWRRRARRHSQVNAVEFLIETYRNATDEIVLVPVGPLSNIASALALFPELVDCVPEVMIMGGGHAVANVTPSAEFNIWADPEAAALVFAAGFP